MELGPKRLSSPYSVPYGRAMFCLSDLILLIILGVGAVISVKISLLLVPLGN